MVRPVDQVKREVEEVSAPYSIYTYVCVCVCVCVMFVCVQDLHVEFHVYSYIYVKVTYCTINTEWARFRLLLHAPNVSDRLRRDQRRGVVAAV